MRNDSCRKLNRRRFRCLLAQETLKTSQSTQRLASINAQADVKIVPEVRGKCIRLNSVSRVNILLFVRN
jgi:hypothetical protein